MSGPNEHHIPQFLQRAFGVKRKGQPNEIWMYTPDAEPESRSISKTGSEDYFYGPELDAKLKRPENTLGAHFSLLRKQPVGATVDPSLAADLVTHLAPRSKHLRTSLAYGLYHLASEAHTVFTDPDQVEAALGLDAEEPGDHFRKNLRDALKDNPQFAALGLPEPLLERMAFYIAKEQFEFTVTDITSTLGPVLARWATDSPTMMRDTHNNALNRLTEGTNPRRDLLATFEWTIESAPLEGALLPDCIALAYGPETPALPLMFSGKDMSAVVMPLTPETLLVGRRPDANTLDLSDFNAEAAACAQEFFLAQANLPALRELCPQIATRSTSYFEDSVRSAFQSVLPTESAKREFDIKQDVYDPAPADTEPFGYNLSCFDFGDQTVSERLADAVSPIIASYMRFLPMARLEGITFAFDYSAALHALDRGRSDFPPLEPPSDDEPGRIVLVEREGRMMVRVMAIANVADCLLSDDEALSRRARHFLAHQFALVAMFGLTDRALPGKLFEPLEDEFSAWLHRHVHDAVNGYVAARLSAAFGSGRELTDHYRDQLVHALDDMRATVEEVRAAFLKHRDVDRVMAEAMPVVVPVLNFSAMLLGHCETANEGILDGEGKLAEALARANLTYWLADYGRHLEAFMHRLGRWRSVNEFLSFNRHVERVLWSVGLFPWRSPEGIRVEVAVPNLEQRAA